MTSDTVTPDNSSESHPSASCRHRWRIAPPDGPFSVGECRNCGETRTFQNSFADTFGGDQYRKGYTASGTQKLKTRYGDLADRLAEAERLV